MPAPSAERQPVTAVKRDEFKPIGIARRGCIFRHVFQSFPNRIAARISRFG
jgi:hypothetical protein